MIDDVGARIGRCVRVDTVDGDYSCMDLPEHFVK